MQVLFAIPGLLMRAFYFLANTRPGRIVGLVLGAILLLKVVDRRAEKRGRTQAKDYIEKASNDAARRRGEARDAIDLDAARVGAAERLRARWRRG